MISAVKASEGVADRPSASDVPVLARIWRALEELGTGLPPRDRRTLRTAIATSMRPGWQPTTPVIQDLMEFLAWKLTIEQYATRVLAHGTTPPKT
jgi:hypothetical protein